MPYKDLNDLVWLDMRTQRLLKPIFRHGLDVLHNIALNLTKKSPDFLRTLKILSCLSPYLTHTINSHLLRFRLCGFANMQRFTIGTTETGGYPALSAHDVPFCSPTAVDINAALL
jgi:hypothetical protein